MGLPPAFLTLPVTESGSPGVPGFAMFAPNGRSGRNRMMTRKGAEHAANIMDALLASQRPLSAYDLLDRLRPTGVAAPLTVYRALDKLMRAGKVHRIESLNAFE